MMIEACTERGRGRAEGAKSRQRQRKRKREAAKQTKYLCPPPHTPKQLQQARQAINVLQMLPCPSSAPPTPLPCYVKNAEAEEEGEEQEEQATSTNNADAIMSELELLLSRRTTPNVKLMPQPGTGQGRRESKGVPSRPPQIQLRWQDEERGTHTNRRRGAKRTCKN